MARFGGSEFIGFSVPLIFKERYFVLEPGDTPLLSVFVVMNGKPVFEVLKNRPVENPTTNVSATPVGFVTVTNKRTGKFIYKVRPGSETSVAFGTLNGDEMDVRIDDKRILIGTNQLANSKFYEMAGVLVEPDGTILIVAPIPPKVKEWLASQ